MALPKLNNDQRGLLERFKDHDGDRSPVTFDGLGVALEAASAGDTIRVCVAGYVEGVKSGSVSAGDSLVAGASGAVAAYGASATDAVLGVALDDDGSSAVTMYWFRKA